MRAQHSIRGARPKRGSHDPAAARLDALGDPAEGEDPSADCSKFFAVSDRTDRLQRDCLRFFHIFLSFQNAPDVVLPGRAPEASHFFCGLAGSTFADWLLIRALYERSVERNLKFSRYLTWGIVRGRFFPWGIFSQCGYGVHTICQALPKWSCRCSFISSSVDRVLQWPCFATPTLLHQQHAFYFM